MGVLVRVQSAALRRQWVPALDRQTRNRNQARGVLPLAWRFVKQWSVCTVFFTDLIDSRMALRQGGRSADGESIIINWSTIA
jgi:hypothetical protein